MERSKLSLAGLGKSKTSLVQFNLRPLLIPTFILFMLLLKFVRTTCLAPRITQRTISTTMAKQARHRFAPLGQKANAEAGQMQLQGIIFDMDGTLCKAISSSTHCQHRGLTVWPTQDRHASKSHVQVDEGFRFHPRRSGHPRLHPQPTAARARRGIRQDQGD